MPPGKGFLNFSTMIAASKTIAEIQQILANHGAKAVLIEYDAYGEIEALSFQVEVSLGHLSIKLPARPDKVLVVLQRQLRARRIQRRWKGNDEDQAVRVAWRVMKDWVEAQMALFETDQVQLEEIFLPYVVTPGGQTVYEVVAGQKFLQAGNTVESEES